MSYGAVGDATADDTAAFQAAINVAKTTRQNHIYIPSGNYRITSSLDITGTFGLRMEGASGYFTAAKLNCQTGTQPVLDLTGSSNVVLENIYLEGESASNPSKVGILLARSMTKGSEQIVLDNVNIRLLSDYAANGGVGTVGVYCFAAEIGSMRDCLIMADNGIVFTRSNLYSAITSPNVTMRTTTESMTVWSMGGAMKVAGGKGPAITFNEAANITFEGYLCQLADPGASPYAYGFKFTGTFAKLIDIHGSIEMYEQAAYIDTDMDSVDFALLTYPDSLSQFVFSNRTGYTRTCTYRVNAGDSTTHTLIDCPLGAWSFYGNRIYLWGGQSISAPASVNAYANEVIDGGSADPSSRITWGTGYAVEQFVSGNVQGARNLTTAESIAIVSSAGTLTQNSNITSTSGVLNVLLGISGGIPRNVGTWQNPSAAPGTYKQPVTTTMYVGSIFIPANMTITGIQYLIGTAVPVAEKVRAALYSVGGTRVAQTVAGGTTMTGSASVTQQLAFDPGTYAAVGPRWHFIGLMFDTATANLVAMIPAGCDAGSGVVGTAISGLTALTPPSSITVPTTFPAGANVPIASLY
jgi:hypothetical protein